MAYQQQHDGYSQPRQQQYYDQAPLRERVDRQQYAEPHGQYAQHYDSQYDEHYGGQYDQHYEAHHDQRYDYGHDQGGHQQWESGYYDQEGGYHDGNGYARQAPQEQRRRPPPQQHRQGHEQAYDEHYQQPPPSQRQDPRSRPSGRGNGPPPNSQPGRGGLRPPGFDRSLFNPAPKKNLPLDSPFPTFPTQKAKQSAPKDTVSGPMSQMSIKDRDGQGRQTGSPGRGQPGPQQNREPEPPRPESNNRQDSGHFEGNGQGQRGAPPRTMSGQRPPPMNINASQGIPPQRTSDPKSPSQQSFGTNTQRSMTMPRHLPSEGQGGYDNQQQWNEPGGVAGQYGSASHNNAPPRPSTAGGVRQNEAQGQRPAMPPPLPPSQQQQRQQQPQPLDQHYQGQDDSLDTFYDDYYGDSTDHNDRNDRHDRHDRKSIASTIDMPNFDAIPETGNRHRRGDSIDNHLSPSIAPSRGNVPTMSSMDPASGYNNDFQQQAHRSRSQPNIHEHYTNSGDEMAGNAPPVPGLPRTNTDFANGLPNGPRGRGPPSRGMTMDDMRGAPNQGYGQEQYSNFDPRYGRQPPPVQRGYSDESTYSEPPPTTMRNASTPFGPGNPIPRPGTAGPVSGRMPADPLGRRPGTTQPRSNPDALPAHPAPVRAGLMQQNQPQQQQSIQSAAPQNARPPPVRQYNSGNSQTSIESQQSTAQRPVSVSHPVTHDELNRLRNTWTANPRDNATALKLAKKLVEAASVLADEGGTADSRTRNKNREKFILEGHKIVKKLVNNGYPDAMFYLADCYGQGLLGLQPDPKEAFALYQSAAKAGHAASAYRTAVCCEMGHEEGGGTKRDLMKAVQWYRRAAALGDVPAMYKMGIILVKGLLGQQKNLGEALNMLKRAADRADRDNPHALHELALIYESQTGNERIIRDEAYSLQLYHQAADLGYKFSQFKLGQAYEYGLLGCQIDARTSIAWYTKSAAQEEHQSELALSGWYLTGIQGVLEQSDTEAYLWARKAACAEPPLPKALFAMGYFTEVGIGCPRSLDEAKRWYGRAAAYKFPKAQERLEELKRGGSKVQMKRERLSRTNQKQQEENCTVM